MSSKNDKLIIIRNRIDKVDDELTTLLNKRATLAKQTTKLKPNTILDPTREGKILKKIKSKNNGPITNTGLEQIYREILSVCREIQMPVQVSYLGPEGSNTNEATIKTFGGATTLLPQASISDIFISVERGETNFGVVPIENSLEGPIGETLDRLTDKNVVIISERSQTITHNLVSKEKSLQKIKTLYSHPQALAQSRRWIQRNLPHVQIKETTSTSSAALTASKLKNVAAIAPKACAKLYSLHLLKSNIQDEKNNTTIFIVIKHEEQDVNLSSAAKISLAFSLDHKPGTLYECLQPFKNAKINLTKIQSRPSRKLQWDYLFFIDFLVGKKHKEAARCVEKLRKATSYFKILGAF